jgi:hypothetical protein
LSLVFASQLDVAVIFVYRPTEFALPASVFGSSDEYAGGLDGELLQLFAKRVFHPLLTVYSQFIPRASYYQNLEIIGFFGGYPQ